MEKNGARRRLRRVLITFTVVLAVLVTAVGSGFAWLWTRADVSTVGKVRFSRPLAVPPLAESTVESDGTRVFDLRMQSGETEFRAGVQTPTWGFNGNYLGPTLRAERGERVKVRVRNALDEASSVHWHGMHLPATMDGGPHQMVAAGKEWTPHWKIDQPAATLWYHPHPHGTTEDQVQRGLAGMFLLDDARSKNLKLPATYGVNDVPVIVQDVTFDGGRFDHDHAFLANTGFLGKRTMVNGTLDPYLEVGDELVRLRLLNASTARIYTFGFDDDRTFDLIGTDGGLLEKPAPMNRIQLSPGERAEVVVRMRAGERSVLRSYPWREGGAWEKRFNGGDDSFDVMELRAAQRLRPSPALPAELGRLELPDVKDTTQGRFFDLRRSGINGKPMAMNRIDDVVTRGATETWTLRNGGDMTHNFHVHDVQFRVLEVNGREPEPALRGRKDTVAVPMGTTMKIVLRFDGPADPDTPYMYHCHLLDHEDHGMMGQFVVVEPGQQAGGPKTHKGH
ncbi:MULTISPECIES: multicopper oxidase family protein [unclassified Streptomyces]|uniref:multicopper oxidase family protein n=1 Tax=unclassified Streptomyces TaxID=2593676 RepID=UPI0018F8A946|nr:MULTISPECIES: multicopper oxidase domain-containing protein [unclassified Streptomyces]